MNKAYLIASPSKIQNLTNEHFYRYEVDENQALVLFLVDVALFKSIPGRSKNIISRN